LTSLKKGKQSQEKEIEFQKQNGRLKSNQKNLENTFGQLNQASLKKTNFYYASGVITPLKLRTRNTFKQNFTDKPILKI
jgi:hypothetical protein